MKSYIYGPRERERALSGVMNREYDRCISISTGSYTRRAVGSIGVHARSKMELGLNESDAYGLVGAVKARVSKEIRADELAESFLKSQTRFI